MAFNAKTAAERLLKIANTIEKEASEVTYFICDNCNHTANLETINSTRSKVASSANIENVSKVTISDKIACPACSGTMSYVATEDSEKYYVEVNAANEAINPDASVPVDTDTGREAPMPPMKKKNPEDQVNEEIPEEPDFEKETEPTQDTPENETSEELTAGPTEAPDETPEAPATEPTEAPDETPEAPATEPTEAPDETPEAPATEPTEAPDETPEAPATEPTDVPDETPEESESVEEESQSVFEPVDEQEEKALKQKENEENDISEEGNTEDLSDDRKAVPKFTEMPEDIKEMTDAQKKKGPGRPKQASERFWSSVARYSA